MRQVCSYQTLKLLKSRLRKILEFSPNDSFTTTELIRRLSKDVAADDVREALWKLYAQGHAEPLQPVPGPELEQRWRMARPQRDQVKNRQQMWQVRENRCT